MNKTRYGMIYGNKKREITEEEAKSVEARDTELWNSFWSVPREKRTAEDWQKLLDIEIMFRA